MVHSSYSIPTWPFVRLEIHQFISRMGSRPTADKLSTLAKQRNKLAKSLAAFNIDSQKYLGVDPFKECLEIIEYITTDFESEWDPTDPPVIYPIGARPESLTISLPSALPRHSSHRVLLVRLLTTELELRKGHANDCLAAMRTTIGQEAYQYKKTLQPAHSKTHRTRARSSIQNVHRALILQTRLYNRTRKAILNIDIESDMLSMEYKELTKNDISVSSAIANPNVAGSSRVKLSWIWTSHHGVKANDDHLTECELFFTVLSVFNSLRTSLSGPLAASKGTTTPVARRSHSYQKWNALGDELLYFSAEAMAQLAVFIPWHDTGTSCLCRAPKGNLGGDTGPSPTVIQEHLGRFWFRNVCIYVISHLKLR